MPIFTSTETLCKVCCNVIAPSDAKKPIETVRKWHVDWVHCQCISCDDARIPVCKHWLKFGKCMFMETCNFRHPNDCKGSNIKEFRPRGIRQRRHIYNDGRAASLRRWLIITFGENYLRSGSGVLDVAGGKGELSFELINLNNIPSTVIDPRPLELSKFKRRLIGGYYHRNSILGIYNTSSQNIEIKSPNHLRILFEMKSQKSQSKYTASPPLLSYIDYMYPIALSSKDRFQAALDTCKALNWTKKGLQHETDSSTNDSYTIRESQDDCNNNNDDNNDEDGEDKYDHNNEEDNLEIKQSLKEDSDLGSYLPSVTPSVTLSVTPSVTPEIRGEREVEGEVGDYEVAMDLIKRCSLVVGMHPDQAAEHIVDFCLRHCKPFAIVPCCVYSNQFPHRRRSDGHLIKTFGDFIEYLLSKHPCIRALEMDFEGKNVLLYYSGQCVLAADPSTPGGIPHVVRGVATEGLWWGLSVISRSHERFDASKRDGEHRVNSKKRKPVIDVVGEESGGAATSNNSSTSSSSIDSSGGSGSGSGVDGVEDVAYSSGMGSEYRAAKTLRIPRITNTTTTTATSTNSTAHSLSRRSPRARLEKNRSWLLDDTDEDSSSFLSLSGLLISEEG